MLARCRGPSSRSRHGQRSGHDALGSRSGGATGDGGGDRCRGWSGWCGNDRRREVRAGADRTPKLLRASAGAADLAGSATQQVGEAAAGQPRHAPVRCSERCGECGRGSVCAVHGRRWRTRSCGCRSTRHWRTPPEPEHRPEHGHRRSRRSTCCTRRCTRSSPGGCRIRSSSPTSTRRHHQPLS